MPKFSLGRAARENRDREERNPHLTPLHRPRGGPSPEAGRLTASDPGSRLARELDPLRTCKVIRSVPEGWEHDGSLLPGRARAGRPGAGAAARGRGPGSPARPARRVPLVTRPVPEPGRLTARHFSKAIGSDDNCPRSAPTTIARHSAAGRLDFPRMTSFSITNLKEVDDSAAERGPDIEARFGRKHLDSQHLGVSYFRYGPGFKAAYGHRHPGAGGGLRRSRWFGSDAPR
jgi:hypothetical protein